MLYKFENKDNWFPDGWISWRYWCECMDARHVLELNTHEDGIEINLVIGYKTSFWRRLKMAWDLLRKGETYLHDIHVTKKDCKEIATIFNGQTQEQMELNKDGISNPISQDQTG